jgi:HK97 family phage major capsid protein
VSADESTQLFPYEYVQKLRHEAASYRTELNTANAALSFYINKYPLGDLENFSVSRHAFAVGQAKLAGFGDLVGRYAPYEKAYLERKATGDQVAGIDGGFLAPEIWGGPYFSLLRSFSVLDQFPITRVSFPARVRNLPKVTADVVASYAAEGVAPSLTAFKIGQLTQTAHKAIHEIAVSNELLRDAPGMADVLLRKESAMAHALDRDTQALTGQGGPNPTGLITLATNGTISKYYANSTATTSIGASATHGVPSFHHVSQLRGKIHQLNGAVTGYTGQAHCNGMIAHTRFEQTVLQLQVSGSATAWTDANGRPLWMGGLGRPGVAGVTDEFADPANLMGQIFALTNILPTNSTDGGGTTSSFMIAGWWDMYVLFECAEFIYDAAIEPAFQNDQTIIRAVHRYDCAPALPEAFAVLAGCDAYSNQ